MKLKIYKVREEYIEFLRKYDSANVKINKNEKRPYIGIVLNVNGVNYFAPLASPAPKHVKMKNSVDFIKIENGTLGAINLNNMIPVTDEGLIEYDILKERDPSYRNLLFKQVNFINNNAENIKKNAENLYEKVVVHKSFLSSRCANFKLLEEKCGEFKLDKAERQPLEVLLIKLKEGANLRENPKEIILEKKPKEPTR